jgi:hypothetical protein
LGGIDAPVSDEVAGGLVEDAFAEDDVVQLVLGEPRRVSRRDDG